MNREVSFASGHPQNNREKAFNRRSLANFMRIEWLKAEAEWLMYICTHTHRHTAIAYSLSCYWIDSDSWNTRMRTSSHFICIFSNTPKSYIFFWSSKNCAFLSCVFAFKSNQNPFVWFVNYVFVCLVLDANENSVWNNCCVVFRFWMRITVCV